MSLTPHCFQALSSLSRPRAVDLQGFVITCLRQLATANHWGRSFPLALRSRSPHPEPGAWHSDVNFVTASQLTTHWGCVPRLSPSHLSQVGLQDSPAEIPTMTVRHAIGDGRNEHQPLWHVCLSTSYSAFCTSRRHIGVSRPRIVCTCLSSPFSGSKASKP